MGSVVVLLRYKSLGLYGAIELLLEIFFQTELFAALPALRQAAGYDATIRGCALTMILAHWLYWAAALGKGVDMLTSLKRDAVRGTQTAHRCARAHAHDRSAPCISRAGGRCQRLAAVAAAAAGRHSRRRQRQFAQCYPTEHAAGACCVVTCVSAGCC